MLDRNIKNLNKMLVKINDNMFGGSTKRPPPSMTASTSTVGYLPSSLLRPESRNEISQQTLKSSGSSVTLPSPLRSASGSGLGPTAGGTSSSLTFSSKSMSMSSFPATATISPTTQQQLQSAMSSATSSQGTQATTVTTALLSGRTKLLRHRHQQQHQQHQFHHHHHHHHYTPQLRFRLLPGLKATSFFTILTLVCLETVLLSTVSNCAKTFYMHWNTSNSIFRIDNTDHIIDVNKGNLAFEFDQVHIICPVYEPGTFENETEKYIIYNVSKVEYETCRITNADPRVIAICDKPQKLMFFTITFRPFTPQPGGLEFLPGNDYYFISTSSKGDLYRRIGGRCSTNNMKVVFKVCCAPEDKNNRTNNNINGSGIGNGGNSGGGGGNSGGGGGNSNTAIQQQQHNNNININGGNIGGGTGLLPSPKLPGMGGGIGGGGGGGIGGNGGGLGGGMNGMNNGVIGGGGGLMLNGNSGTSINTNIDQFNRIPMQQPNNIGGMGGGGNMGMNGMGGSGGMGQHQTGIRINNVPSSQQHPSQKNDDYDKHANEVVKNEELTYNSAASSLSFFKMARRRTSSQSLQVLRALRYNNHSRSTSYKSIYQKLKSSLLELLLYTTSNHRNPCNPIADILNFIFNCNPIIITTTVLVALTNLFQYKIMTSWNEDGSLQVNKHNTNGRITRCQSRVLVRTRSFVKSLSSFRRRQDEEREGDLPPSSSAASFRDHSSAEDCIQDSSSSTTKKNMLKSNTSDHSQMESSTTRPTSNSPTRLWLLQTVTLMLVINQFGLPVAGNSHELLDEVALIQGNNEPATDESTAQLLDEVKRSWQSLQGSWGKRDHGAPSAAPDSDDYDVQIPEWSPSEIGDHPEMMKYSVIYASNPNALAAAVAAAATASDNADIIGEEGDTPSTFEKKSWKNMNVAWGKRRSAVWNKFRGAWGKREPGWNNLKGMWGKRSSGDWKKLQSAWGKRTLQQ